MVEGKAKQKGVRFMADCPRITLHDWSRLFPDSYPYYAECEKYGKCISMSGCARCMEATQLDLFVNQD